VETLVMQDAPARAIVAAAREMRADMIVMGTHGRHGWRRAILGSVTESVLHDTDRPVLTVTPGIVASGIKRVLCPVNFTYIARESLRSASSIASAFGAELVVMYVAEGVQPPQLPDVEAAFNLWVDPAVRGRAQYRLSVVSEGNPAERVLDTAGNIEADLIVIGAQHKFFSDATVIGTTTQRITRFARCPVLTVVRRTPTQIHVEAEEHEEAVSAL
jgi:nucleotide-binding universal stress UspA family protein